MNTATIKGDSAHTGAPFYFISSVREGNYGHWTFYYVVVQLCLYPTIMSEVKKKTEKKKDDGPGLPERGECTCTRVSTQTDTDGWSLPVEPVICVAWKWERVIAAEVVAGVGILQGPNGGAHQSTRTGGEKKERPKWGEGDFAVKC